MYVNERDEMNFHEFLKNARNWLGASQSEVAKGIYTNTSLHRAETGMRIPEKMIRDRLLSRMGFHGERHVEYLCLPELQQLRIRQEIIQSIVEKNLAVTEMKLKELKQFEESNAVQKQFIKTMEFLMLQQSGASREELCRCVKEAIDCTVPNIDKALIGRHMLAEQELNLIAEYIHLQTAVDKNSNANSWRVLEYQKMIFYIHHSHMENLVKVKVYPKIICYMCEAQLKDSVSLNKLRESLKLCDKALELLLDTHRLYYFYELLEYRREILKRMLECQLAFLEKDEVEARLTENTRLEKLWKAQYDAYGVSPYMQDFCYMYWETACYSAVEIIEIRRKMLRIPRKVLREGICTERSLIRIERTNYNPSMYVLTHLFERMGLCGEYRSGQLVTTDIHLLNVYKQLVDALNNDNRKDCEICLEELQSDLSMLISHNQQELNRIISIYEYRLGNITKKQFYEQMVDALECTLPIWALYHPENSTEMYFTRSELCCICDLAFHSQGKDSERCAEIVEEICQKELQKGIHPMHLGIMELLINHLSAHLKKKGRNAEAEQLQYELIRTCLLQKRMPYTFIHPEQVNVMWIE